MLLCAALKGRTELVQNLVRDDNNLKVTIYIVYSGKFSHGANFRIFRMHILHAKIKATKICTFEIFA